MWGHQLSSCGQLPFLSLPPREGKPQTSRHLTTAEKNLGTITALQRKKLEKNQRQKILVDIFKGMIYAGQAWCEYIKVSDSHDRNLTKWADSGDCQWFQKKILLEWKSITLGQGFFNDMSHYMIILFSPLNCILYMSKLFSWLALNVNKLTWKETKWWV